MPTMVPVTLPVTVQVGQAQLLGHLPSLMPKSQARAGFTPPSSKGKVVAEPAAS